MRTVKDEILSAISVRDFYKTEFSEWQETNNSLVSCPMKERHEGGNDSTPSLSIDPDTGKFYCHGCGWKGTSVVGYYCDVHAQGDIKKALATLYTKYIGRVFSSKTVREYVGYRSGAIDRRLMAVRGWDPLTLNKLRIGWDPVRKRVTIPIYNQEGMCLDIRYHDSLYQAELSEYGKRITMLNPHKVPNGNWFPVNPKVNPLRQQEVWFVEGEPDAITCHQEGINAITCTGGAQALAGLPYEKLRVLEGKDIVLCLDSDKAGQDAAKDLATRLASVGITSLKNVVVPQGKDVTEFIIRYDGTAQDLKQEAGKAVYLIKPKRDSARVMHLSETSKADYFNKPVITEVLINGKAAAPMLVPKRVRMTCTGERCNRCPCGDSGTYDYLITDDDERLLEWMVTKKPEKLIISDLKVPNCKMQVEPIEYRNIEEVSCIPALTLRASDDQSQYVMRTGYFLGHGIDSNQTYKVQATPLAHPWSKESVLVINKAESHVDSLKNVRLTNDDARRLRSVIDGHGNTWLRSWADWASHKITRIYGRSLAHIVIDLAFHSVREFSFAGVDLPKGSLEVLLAGDTRCGKGQIAEGLVRGYDLGTVISGENASFMGLCGGAIRDGDSFRLVWGAIPVNHGRLVVVDEFTGLDKEVLGKLSRIRSEGVAEINKGGIMAKTPANARMIWIANPRGGKDVASFSSGVQMIQDLIRMHEDIARFDLAFVVAKGEVPVSEINKLTHTQPDLPNLNIEDLRKLVLWVWSRNADQVIFTKEATDYILETAVQLAADYSSAIPLIQGENARFKLAKLAAAVAGKYFSSPDGTRLLVTVRHAKIAVSILRACYNSKTMGYAAFSDLENKTSTLKDADELDKFFRVLDKDTRTIVLNGLMQAGEFGVREFMDWCGTDGNVAKRHIGLLVRCRALLQQTGGLYIKRPAFVDYIRKAMKQEEQ